MPDAVAARSSGFFAVAGLWMWAQYSYYVYGSNEPDQGRLAEQAVFVESGSRTRLKGGVAELTQTCAKRLAPSQERTDSSAALH